MSRGDRQVAAIFLSVALAVVLAACKADEGGGSGDPGSGASTSAEPAPVTLGEGDALAVEARSGRLGATRSTGGAPPGVLVTDDRVVETTGDDVIRVVDRATHEAVWQHDFTEPAKGREDGLCTDPVVSPDGAHLVIGMTIDQLDCARIVLIDLETGDVVSDVPLISKTFTGYDITFYRHIRAFAVVAGSVWWTADDAVGSVDETGRPATVLGKHDLHLRGDDQTYSVAVPPDGDLFIVEVGHGTPTTKRYRREWFGIRPAADGSAEIAWVTPESPKGVGFHDLASPLNVELFDGIGAPVVASLTRNRLAVGHLDAATGRLDRAAVIGWSYLSLFEPSYSRSEAVDGSRLFVAAGPPKDEQTSVLALDLDAGRQLWRTDVTPTPSVERGERPSVMRVARGTDGDLYALVGDPDLGPAEIQRFDSDTGEQTGVWSVPEDIDYIRYDLAVVDDTVVLTAGDAADAPGLRRSYWLRVAS